MNNFKQPDKLYQKLSKIVDKSKLSLAEKMVVVSDIRDEICQKQYQNIHKSSQKLINEKFYNLINK